MTVERDHVAERFEEFVLTRTAQLICDACGHSSQYTKHTYSHLIINRAPVSGFSAILDVDVNFICAVCGTLRKWGRIGPNPHRDPDETETPA